MDALSERDARRAAVRLSLRISAPIVLVSVLALGLTAFLNVGKFDRTLAEVEESRLRFTLNELRANLETGLDLGLTVSGLGNAQAALDHEVAQDPDILAISVIDTDGSPVFSSGQLAAAAAPASTVTAASAASAHAASAPNWIERGQDSITVGTRLVDNLGVDAGTLVLRYSSAKRQAMVTAVATRLAIGVAVTVLLATLVLVVGIDRLVRRMDRQLAAMQDALDAGADAGTAMPLVEELRHTTAAASGELAAARAALGAP